MEAMAGPRSRGTVGMSDLMALEKEEPSRRSDHNGSTKTKMEKMSAFGP